MTRVKEIKGKRKVQGVLQSQTAALPRPHEEEETDKSKQAQTEQTYQGENVFFDIINKTKYLDANVYVPAQILHMFT